MRNWRAFTERQGEVHIEENNTRVDIHPPNIHLQNSQFLAKIAKEVRISGSVFEVDVNVTDSNWTEIPFVAL